MTTNKIPKLKTLKGQARNAFWLSVFTAVGASLFGAYNFYFATSSGIWQLYGVALLMAGFATATSIGAWFAFHENAQQSGWVMLLSFLFSVAGMSFLIAGMGRIMIVPIIILGISGTVLMLSAKTQQQAILITILGGIAGLLVDFFVPRFQIEFQSDIDIMTIIIGTISAVFALVLVRQFSSYPFRTKLVLAFIFLSSLVIGAAFTLINLTMRQVLETNANEKLLANASASANNVDTFLSYTLDSVSTASAYLDLRSYLLLAPEKRQNTQTERQVQNLLFSSKNSNPDILSYGLLDINGINVIDSDTANIGRNESTEDYFQLSLNANEKYISPVLYLPDEKEAVLFFSVPVHNEMGIITGVLRVKYRASALQDVLINERNIVGEGSYSALFDSNHIFLAHSQNPNLIGKIAYPPSSEDINNLRENLLVPSLIPDEDIFHDNKELEERLSDFASTPYFSSENLRSESATSGAVTQLETVPWLITTAQPSVIFLAPIQEQTRRIFIAALVLIAFAIFSGIALSNILIAPILRLKNTAQKFVEGDLNAVASVDTDDEIGSLALTFNNLVSRLRGIVETLENRVEERTKDLETRTGYLEGAAEVSRAVGSMLDTNMLIVQIVDLIKERFGLYYVGLFLTDNKNEWAVLKAGTGEAGQRMLQREHRLRIGEGMIGWSIENEEARIALDVGEDAVRFENPDLPETRSEGALPLRSRGRVLGALTVQSTEESAFDESIITTLQTMADQVAVALDNAELFAKSEEALLAERKAYGQLSQESWQKISQSQNPRYIVQEDGTVTSVEDEKMSIDLTQVAGKSELLQDDGLTAIIPIKNRDYTLGGIKIRKNKDAEPWTEEELEITQAISEQLSVALESARLFDETQRKAEREAIISDITAKIGSSIQMESILRTTVQELGLALDSPEVTFELTDPKAKKNK